MDQTKMGRKIKLVTMIFFAPLSALADHAAFQIDGGPGSAITTMGAATLATGKQVVALQYQYLELDELSNDVLLGSDEALHSVNSFSQATLGYSLGITDTFTLSAVLPYVSRDSFREVTHDHNDETEEPEHGHEEPEHGQEESEAGHHDNDAEAEGEVLSSDLSGWGDISLLGRLALNPDNSGNRRYALLAGFKVPTGRTNEKLRNGEKAEVDHQPGSGSWDPLVGIAYSNQLNRQWSVSSNLLYHLTTEGKRETEIGDSLAYNAAVLWAPTSHAHHGDVSTSHIEHTWQYVLEVNGEWRDKTEIDGSKDDNTGGNVIFASAGLRWGYGGWGTHISLGAPLYKDFNGVQSEPDWLLSTGLSLAF